MCCYDLSEELLGRLDDRQMQVLRDGLVENFCGAVRTSPFIGERACEALDVDAGYIDDETVLRALTAQADASDRVRAEVERAALEREAQREAELASIREMPLDELLVPRQLWLPQGGGAYQGFDTCHSVATLQAAGRYEDVRAAIERRNEAARQEAIERQEEEEEEVSETRRLAELAKAETREWLFDAGPCVPAHILRAANDGIDVRDEATEVLTSLVRLEVERLGEHGLADEPYTIERRTGVPSGDAYRTLDSVTAAMPALQVKMAELCEGASLVVDGLWRVKLDGENRGAKVWRTCVSVELRFPASWSADTVEFWVLTEPLEDEDESDDQ